jgi:membrane protein implicated in regulation of membrane protease activity
VKRKESITRRNARWHTIYSIISTVIEEAAIGAGLIWLLPPFGINVPVWGVALILAGNAVFSYLMYRVGHPTISYGVVGAPESIVGSTGVVKSRLNPDGFVKVSGELWRASCADTTIEKGQEVIVTGINGLKLTVMQKQTERHENAVSQ